MMDLNWCTRFALFFSALPLGVVGLVLIGVVGDLPRRRKLVYAVFLLLPMLISLAEIILMLVGLNEVPSHITPTLELLRDLLLLPGIPILIVFLLWSCGEPLRRNPALYTVCGIRGLQTVEMIWRDDYVGPDGALRFEAPLIAAILLGCVLFIACIVILVRRWKKLTAAQRVFFALSLLVSQPWIILLFELYLMKDMNLRYLAQREEVIRQQEEIIRKDRELLAQKTQVAVLQMRPHFIYNTLISIYYLCRQDALKAQQVILDFSRYLKNNFCAIVSEDCIPFAKELEHTRAYLAVEKARFEDKLFVELDTPVTNFALPPLTLQPLVENAVRYGISPDLEPLHLSVRTKETETGVSVIVEDTGPGFKPEQDEEPHIALNNIRTRLQSMCGGSLTIAPRDGGGTSVTVFVPWIEA